MSYFEANLCRAQNAIDGIWQHKSDTFLLRATTGRTIENFPDLSEAGVSRVVGAASDGLAAIEEIDISALPHQTALTVNLASFQLGIEAQAMNRYWIAQDLGFFPAMFPVGPYGSSYLFSLALKTFAEFTFSRRSDFDHYLGLIEDYARLIDQMREKLTEQAGHGIRIPQPALTGIRRVVSNQADAARQALVVKPSRCAVIAMPEDFSNVVARRIADRIAPAFAALLDAVGADYAARAPTTVGMAQFNDGERIYESLVAEHLSMTMTVEAVHRAGLDRMARVEADMAQLRGRLGYSDRDDFHRYLMTDPDWVAHSVADIQNRFDAAIGRIEPRIEELFNFKPVARFRTARLDPKLEAGMTYGYYQDPMAGHPDGVYYFNGSDISKRTLATASALIFHELIPGHHLHSASQKENQLLHPLRQNSFFNAFTEGWAEYAATLADEIGMYANPCERYGRMLMDAFLTSRLVVDTGMNALGWTLDQARQYMRKHTILSEGEIHSETLRYSTDIPAQSLSYKIGEVKILELRERARAALGSSFDIRDFHDAVLGSGGMPLDVLEWHVQEWLETATVARESTPLVAHGEVVIEAEPAAIWPHILDLNSWKQGAKLVPIAGQPGLVGARFHAVSTEPANDVLFVAENVEVLAERRRTLRLRTLDGRLIGFASWRLTPRTGSTRVEYDVYCEDPSPRGSSTVKNADVDEHHRRFGAEFTVLKRLVEIKPINLFGDK